MNKEQELENEVQSLAEQLEATNDALMERTEERDAFAASLADVKAAAVFFSLGFVKEMERRTADPKKCLARRDAEKQKEVLHRLHNRYLSETGGHGSISPFVWDELQALHRLAEKKGCGRRFAAGQWWSFCGETDMGQTDPALCVDCGGEFKLKEKSDE